MIFFSMSQSKINIIFLKSQMALMQINFDVRRDDENKCFVRYSGSHLMEQHEPSGASFKNTFKSVGNV